MLQDDAHGRELLNTVATAIGAAEETVVAREDTFRAVRMLFELLAQSRPVVVVFDDLQWAEPTLLDLVDHIADWSRDAPLFVLCVARPELLDARPSWGGGKLNATTILLEPLSESDAETLIDNLLVGGNLSDPLRERITASAEGNPLFLLQLLLEVGEATRSTLPGSIQALVHSRMDRLPTADKAALQAAAVLGQRFHADALGHVLESPGYDCKVLVEEE